MREDHIQIEKQIGTNYYTKLKIHWIDECRYEASILESNFPYSDSIQQIRKKIILKTEIIKGTDDYYVFKSHSDQSTEMMIDTLWIDKTR